MAKTTAKKTAKKKAPAPKKKAKRGPPTKHCPKCNKELHAAKAACDCGYKFPAKKKRVKKAARSAGTVSSGEGVLSRRLEDSIRIVEKAGGLDRAKETLAAVKELEKLK
jgi:hypothetical protein